MPDPDPAISGAGSVLAGSRSGLRFKRHGHGSVQALEEMEDLVSGANCGNRKNECSVMPLHSEVT